MALPAWIESSPHSRGNFAWRLTRALHLAGRCNVGPVYVCHDGTVFTSAQLKSLPPGY